MIEDQLKYALEVAHVYHDGQTDKGGAPYIIHVIRVGMAAAKLGEKFAIVGLLHDIIEDTDMTEYLLRQKFDDEIVDAVVALTHREGEKYHDYIKRIKTNQLAREIKKIDLTHNMDLARLGREPTQFELDRVRKYQKAYKELTT